MPTLKRRSLDAAFACRIALFAVLAAPAAQAEWYHRVDDGIMGTRITVELWADDPVQADRAIEAVLAEMRRVDELMSTYKPTSELSKVNAGAARHPVAVTPELFHLLETSLEYSKVTEGAFDITYASVGYLYDFRKHVHPTEQAIEQALPGINYRHVLLDPAHSSVRFSQAGVRIDLGGIAKGHSVDRAIALLEAMGIRHAAVSAGGDSRVIGDRFGKPWIIGIRNPRAADPDAVITRIPLEDAAISTSGDYERYFEEGGVRYHHILDPKTGHSASKVLSASIIGPTATRTDGLSKTAFVLGPEEALRIIDKLDDVDAVFVTPDGRVLYSKGLEPPH
ncbi:MAG TPA: FAD:protein FMN transferase [Steroidobacteraceae bacterium]|nr:FAD:protein FMN transferase [Steroidobacteraceae bacterium]